MDRRQFLKHTAALAASTARPGAAVADRSGRHPERALPTGPGLGQGSGGSPPSAAGFVRAEGGEFWIGEHTWHPFGVNYWPRYVTAQRICGAVVWYHPVRYQPRVVDEDFSILRDIGATAIAIALVPGPVEPEFWFQESHVAYGRFRGPLCDGLADNVLDVLERAERHGLRVSCYLLGCHPFYFNDELAERWLVQVGLKDEARIWAFDIAWEPHLVDHTNQRWRKQLDPAWNAWVAERYGSVQEAFAQWGYPPKHAVKGTVPSPEPKHLHSAGPWDAWVAAYARFVHDFVGSRYRTAMAKLRRLDSNHLFGGHTVGLTGQIMEGLGPQTEIPARGGDAIYYHDAQAVGVHLDYLSVEWTVHPLSVYYAKLWSGGKPVVFGEFGFNLAGKPDGRAAQARAYRGCFETILASGAQGALAWWWPGGGRRDEGGSDFGLVEPDGSRRPVLDVFRAYAPAFKKDNRGSPTTGPEERLVMAADRYSPGFFLACNRVALRLSDCLRHGRRARVVTPGTGTDSSNCPLVTVGGQPYGGRGVLQHLDAQFVEVAVRSQGGKWRPLVSGSELTLPRDGPVSFRVVAQNIQQATWKAGDGPGCVRLTVWADGMQIAEVPLPHEVGFGGTVLFRFAVAGERVRTAGRLTLFLAARQRCTFGERFGLRFSHG